MIKMDREIFLKVLRLNDEAQRVDAEKAAVRKELGAWSWEEVCQMTIKYLSEASNVSA